MSDITPMAPQTAMAGHSMANTLRKSERELSGTDILGLRDGEFVVLPQADLEAGRAGDFDGLILRPENFGGQGLSQLNRFVIHRTTEVTVLEPGPTARMRLTIPGIRQQDWPFGESVRIQGALNPENNGNFAVHAIREGEWLEVINADAVPETGRNIKISAYDVRIDRQDFRFDANGTINATGGNFDNRQALDQLIGTARILQEAGRPFATTLALAQKAYPTSPGFDLRGLSNLALRGSGRTNSGIVQLADAGFTEDRPHLFYCRPETGDPQATRITLSGLFLMGAGNALSSSAEYGDGYGAGRGDLFHAIQKKSGDETETQASSRFANSVGGVDPQFDITDCTIRGASRHNVVLGGRGDCRIFYNHIGDAECNGIVYNLYDSKMGFNVISGCGESAVRFLRGSNNIQVEYDLYYFNGTNQGRRIPADAPFEDIMAALCTVWVDATNIKFTGTRLEDSAAAALVIGGRANNLQAALDLNSVGSLGPVGSDRDFPTYPGLQIGGIDWYGENGIPAVYVMPGAADLQGVEMDLLWRTGRRTQAVSEVVRLGASGSGRPYSHMGLRITTGVNQNKPDRPTVDAPAPTWEASGGVQHFSGRHVALDDGTRIQQVLDEVTVRVNGVLDHQVHCRPRRALFEDRISAHDPLLVFDTEVPDRIRILDMVVDADAGTLELTLEEPAPAANFQALRIIGSRDNRGRYRIRRISGNRVILDAPDAVPEIPRNGTRVIMPAEGELRVPARQIPGAERRYLARTIGASARGDMGSVTIRGLGDGSGSAVLQSSGQEIVTRINHLGQEVVISNTA